MMIARLSVVAVASLGLFACGGGARIADNKEAAASAAFAASRGANSTSGSLRGLPMFPALTTATTVDCPNGGTASTRIDANGIDSEGNAAFSLTYDNCNWDGATAMSGTVNVGMSFVFDSSSSFSMSLSLQGRVNFSGEISDFVDMNITETIDASRLSETSGTVSIVLDGTITTSSNTYTYDNETVVVTADGIQGAQG